MNSVKDALLRLVRAGLSTKKMQEAYLTVGLDDNMLFVIYGNILDAIYALVGEHTETFEESVTHLVMTAPLLTDERRVEMLMAEHKKHFGVSAQPAPYITEPEEMKRMFQENGGYLLRETPEGDWS